MNLFISLNLADGGILAVRPERISAVISHEPGYESVLVDGKIYDIVAGQFTLNKLGEHCSHAGVRVA